MRKSVLIGMCVLGLNTAVAQSYKLHSVFIYSFTRYIQWPEAYNQGDFEIMVLGDSPIIDELKSMAQSKKVGERSIKVTRVSSTAEIHKCNMLFVPAAKSDQLSDVLAKTGNQSILVITEQPGMGAKGSDINFLLKDGKPVFELNQSAVTKRNLKVSNDLTRLAIMI